MNLVLIGYRGTGKSAVARRLSRRLQMPCFSLDEEIAKQAGMSIPEIVERFGWEKFRDLESQVARELMGKNEVIIDTGGGVVERQENHHLLRENACIIWLRAQVETIVRRIQSGSERPALTEGKSFTEEVAEVLERRTPLYRSLAHCQIETDAMTPQQIVEEIVALWEKRGA